MQMGRAQLTWRGGVWCEGSSRGGLTAARVVHDRVHCEHVFRPVGLQRVPRVGGDGDGQIRTSGAVVAELGVAETGVDLHNLAIDDGRRASVDGVLVVRVVVPDADRHVRPMSEVARDDVAVGAATAAPDVVLVVQVVDAVHRVKDWSVRIVLATREVTHVELGCGIAKRPRRAHLIAGSTGCQRAVWQKATAYVFRCKGTERRARELIRFVARSGKLVCRLRGCARRAVLPRVRHDDQRAYYEKAQHDFQTKMSDSGERKR